MNLVVAHFWSVFCSALEQKARSFVVVKRSFVAKTKGKKERKNHFRCRFREKFFRSISISKSFFSLLLFLFRLAALRCLALPDRRTISSVPVGGKHSCHTLRERSLNKEKIPIGFCRFDKKTKKMAGAKDSEALDVARSQLAGELRASVGFDAETAAGVVEALFSGSMDAESVVGGLLGGDSGAAAAVSRFCSAVERARGGGSGGGSSSTSGGGGGAAAMGASSSSPSSSSASTYQPASLSAEAAAARARDEASRSAAAAVAAVSTGALAAVPAGARAGRALVFKEAKPPQVEKAAGEASGSGSGSNKQALLGEKKVLPADRDHANCLFCGRVYFTRSAEAGTRRLLETGRCVSVGCGARVALRAGEVRDVRPAGRRPSEAASPSSSPSSEAAAAAAAASAAAFVEDLARNPWLSSSERAAAIASVRDAEGAVAAGAVAGPVKEEEEEEEEEGAALEPAPSSSKLLFSLPPSRRRHGNHGFGGKAGGSYHFDEGDEEEEEEKKQVIPGYYAPDEERSRAKGKGKKRGG